MTHSDTVFEAVGSDGLANGLAQQPSEALRHLKQALLEGTPWHQAMLEAMGLKASRLPWVVLVCGLVGATGGMLMQYWVAVHAYPLIISGKPLFSWPAFVPVTFELGVLFGALGAVFGMLAFNQLPMLYHPLFSSRAFERATDDGFFISIESWDPNYDETQTSALLREAGALDIEVVRNE